MHVHLHDQIAAEIFNMRFGVPDRPEVRFPDGTTASFRKEDKHETYDFLLGLSLKEPARLMQCLLDHGSS